MNSEADNASQAFVEVAIHKMEKPDKRIEQIEALMQKQLETDNEIKKICSAIASLNEALHNESISKDNISILKIQMDMLPIILATPPDYKILQHHHVPGIISAIILAIMLFIICAGWFYTWRKLDNFITNDAKYRALKLDTAIYPLQQYLDRMDFVYVVNPGMRDNVLKKEQEYKDNFYRVQKALRLREEARELEKGAAKNDPVTFNFQQARFLRK